MSALEKCEQYSCPEEIELFIRQVAVAGAQLQEQNLAAERGEVVFRAAGGVAIGEK